MNIKKKTGGGNIKKGFTIVELLVVIGILAVLTIGVLFFLNPAQLQSQARDNNRVSDMTTVNQDIALYHETVPAGSLGTSSIIYVSIPDPTATTTAGTNCAGLGLVPIGNTTYHCAASSTYKMTNGTGWIPVNFAAASSSTLLPTLPVDPINTTSSGEYYVYAASGTQYEVMADPESLKIIAAGNTSSSFIQGNNQGIFGPALFGKSAIWVVDSSNRRIEEFSSTGVYVSQASSFAGGPASPYEMAIDASGNIWVTDTSDGVVQEFSSTGAYLSEFGSRGSGNGQFGSGGPDGIAIDGSGNIWVSDAGNNRVEKFSSTGAYVSQFGSYGSGNGQFYHPDGMAIDSHGNIWVGDVNNARVEEFSSAGSYLSQFGTSGNGNGQFDGGDSFMGMAIDGNGNIWVSDGGNSRVEEFSSTGSYLSQFGSNGTGNGQFGNSVTEMIAIDGNGNMWITDGGNNRVEEFSNTGSYLSQFGSNGSSNGKFSWPIGIAIH